MAGPSAWDAIAKARRDAQDLTPTEETLVGNPRLGSGHPINAGLTTGSTTADEGTEHTATRLRGGLKADPSNVARVHFEEGDWATKLTTGDKLPGEYVFGDTAVKSPKILQVGVDHPTAGQGFHTDAGFIPYSYLSESVETQGQRMERERIAKEIAASKDAENKMMVEWARGVLGPGSDPGDGDDDDIEEAEKWLFRDAEWYAEKHGKHKHVDPIDIYKAGGLDRNVAIDNAVGVEEVRLGPDLAVEVYHHPNGATEPYIVDTRGGETKYLAMEGHPEYHKIGAR